MSNKEIYVGIELLLQLINAASGAIRQARAEGRDVTPEEIAAAKSSLDAHLSELDALIEEKEEENEDE